MAGGDLLRELIRGYIRRDDAAFRAAAEALVREERAKNHRLLADDLERILYGLDGASGERRAPKTVYDIPKDRERGLALLDIAEFDLDWSRLILPSKPVEALQQIATEHHRRDVLAAGGLQPTQRILFYGPPGCGKTLAARVLASVLSYPLVTVRFDAVVSSYLGETASNLRRVFDFVERGQWVVLFDEFDALGKDRDNPFEHGEIKRVVNTLLQLMDAFRGESLLIAATNHEKLLDSAVWRRFEAVIRLPPPSEQDRVLLLRLFLRSFDSSQLNIQALARRLKGATGADIERIAVEAARRALLDARHTISRADVDPAVDAYHHRAILISQVAREREGTGTSFEDGPTADAGDGLDGTGS